MKEEAKANQGPSVKWSNLLSQSPPSFSNPEKESEDESSRLRLKKKSTRKFMDSPKEEKENMDRNGKDEDKQKNKSVIISNLRRENMMLKNQLRQMNQGEKKDKQLLSDMFRLEEQLAEERKAKMILESQLDSLQEVLHFLFLFKFYLSE